MKDGAQALIVGAVRTPIGRHNGALRDVRPDDLAALVVGEVVRKAGIEPALVEEVYMGCANQAGEDNRNVARMAALLAGLPESVAGVTVNRLCASGLSAVVGACHAVIAGDGDLFVAGGVESMSRAPLAHARPEYGDGTEWDTQLGWRFPNPRLEVAPREDPGERDRQPGLAFPPLSEVGDRHEPVLAVREAALVDDQAGVHLACDDRVEDPVVAELDHVAERRCG